MRILLVCDHFPTYGSKSVASLAKSLVERGHDVMVASTSTGIRGEFMECKNSPYLISRFPSIALGPLQYTYTPLARSHLKSLAHEFHPDIVHIQFMVYWLSLSSSTLRRNNFPLVLTLHGLTLPEEPSDLRSRIGLSLLYRTFGANLIKNVSAIFCVSSEVKQKLAKLYPSVSKTTKVIPIGIDSETLDGSSKASRDETRERLGLDGKIVFVFVGRVVPDKGMVELAYAFRNMRSQRNDVSLVIVGDGVGVPAMKTILRCVPDVIFTGFQEDIGTYLQAADVFVLPSYREGMSTAVIEAMYFGLPIISTVVGGAGDLLDLGCKLIPVKVKDTMALTKAMVKTANMGRLTLSEWGTTNWKIARKYLTWDKIVGRIVAEYRIAAENA